jgi:hypothetical protein
MYKEANAHPFAYIRHQIVQYSKLKMMIASDTQRAMDAHILVWLPLGAFQLTQYVISPTIGIQEKTHPQIAQYFIGDSCWKF